MTQTSVVQIVVLYKNPLKKKLIEQLMGEAYTLEKMV